MEVAQHHFNGGPEIVHCANCGTALGDERAVASSPGGVRFFCKQDPEQPANSCYLSWRRQHH